MHEQGTCPPALVLVTQEEYEEAKQTASRMAAFGISIIVFKCQQSYSRFLAQTGLHSTVEEDDTDYACNTMPVLVDSANYQRSLEQCRRLRKLHLGFVVSDEISVYKNACRNTHKTEFKMNTQQAEMIHAYEAEVARMENELQTRLLEAQIALQVSQASTK